MAVRKQNNVAYSLGQPTSAISPEPIIARRAPTRDDKAQLGTIWIDQQNNVAYVLTSVEDNAADWVTVSGDGIKSILTDNGVALPVNSQITIEGDSNITVEAVGDIITVNFGNNLTLPETNAAKDEGVISIGDCEFFTYSEDLTEPNSNIFIGQNMPFIANIGQSIGVVCIGSGAMSSASVFDFAIGIGYRTMEQSGGGDAAIAIGGEAMLDGGGDSAIAIGTQAMFNSTGNTDGIAIGREAMKDGAAAADCIAIGRQSMFLAGSAGIGAIAIGSQSMQTNGGDYSIAIGFGTMSTGCGELCIAIGALAGNDTPSTVDNCIYLANPGDAAETNGTIRIGNDLDHLRAFISGIRGVTTGVNDAIPVVIDSAGQLGTVSSSLRFKENIEEIEAESSKLYQARPVSFTYKDQTTPEKHYGFIAEEFEHLFPELVVKDDGHPTTIKYHELYALMIKELQNLRAEVDVLQAEIQSLKGVS